MYQLKDHPYSSHSHIVKLIKDIPDSSRVLEVGTASGYIGRQLSQRSFDLTGIEKDASLAQQARVYYRKIYNLDLNFEEIPALEPFDVIILADILEHLYEPDSLLKKMPVYLKENGIMIISLPNIANWVMRLELLFGNFNYRDRGILDKTHLRFFTLKTAKKLIKESGFKIIGVYPASLPFQLAIKSDFLSYFLNMVYYSLAKLFPGFFAYQLIFVVKK